MKRNIKMEILSELWHVICMVGVPECAKFAKQKNQRNDKIRGGKFNR
jgi:hypothetical protein